jgi:hypothetical protein
MNGWLIGVWLEAQLSPRHRPMPQRVGKNTLRDEQFIAPKREEIINAQ